MTSQSGIEKHTSIEEESTELVPAAGLRSGDEIKLADGQFAVVTGVALYPCDRTMRGRKLPKCRIRVSIPGKNISSGGSITAGQGDFFTKLAGVRLK